MEKQQLACYPRSVTCSLRNSACCVLLTFNIYCTNPSSYAIRGVALARLGTVLVAFY